jgi:hypothetical protein
MTVFYWIASILFLAVAAPCAFFFARYLATGDDRQRFLAVRFYRWAALVALATFNISIFRRIILIIIHW